MDRRVSSPRCPASRDSDDGDSDFEQIPSPDEPVEWIVGMAMATNPGHPLGGIPESPRDPPSQAIMEEHDASSEEVSRERMEGDAEADEEADAEADTAPCIECAGIETDAAVASVLAPTEEVNAKVDELQNSLSENMNASPQDDGVQPAVTVSVDLLSIESNETNRLAEPTINGVALASMGNALIPVPPINASHTPTSPPSTTQLSQFQTCPKSLVSLPMPSHSTFYPEMNAPNLGVEYLRLTVLEKGWTNPGKDAIKKNEGFQDFPNPVQDDDDEATLRLRLRELNLPSDIQDMIINEAEYNNIELFSSLTSEDIEDIFRNKGITPGKKRRIVLAVSKLKASLKAESASCLDKTSQNMIIGSSETKTASDTPPENEAEDIEEYEDAVTDIVASQPVNQPGSQPVNQPASQPASQPVDQPVDLFRFETHKDNRTNIEPLECGKYEIEHIAATSIILKWNTENSVHGASYDISYKKINEKLLSRSGQIEKNGVKDCVLRIDKLETGQKYQFKIKENYLKKQLKNNSITTQPILIGVKPSALSWLEPQSYDKISRQHKIRFSWKVPSDFGGSDELWYTVEILDIVTEEKVNFKQYPSKSTDFEDYEEDLSHIIGKCIFRVKAHNAIGETDWLVSSPFLTGKVPGQPRGPITYNTDRNCLHLQWKEPINNGGYPLKSYMIEIEELDSKRKIMYDTSATSYECQDIPNGIWKAEIRAITEYGKGPGLVQTKMYVGTKPDKLKDNKVSFTRNSATLSWNEPSDNGGIALTGYEIQKCIVDPMNETGFREWTPITSLESSKRIHTLEELTDKQEIQFRIRAMNPIGGGEWLETDPFYLSEIPGVPEGPIDKECLSKTAVQLKWKAPKDDGAADILQYAVTIYVSNALKNRPQEIRRVETGNSDTQKLLEDLPTATNLIFCIEACNRNGYGKKLSSEPLFMLGKPSQPLGPIEIHKVDRDSATLKWNAPEDNGGDIDLDYLIEYRWNENNKWKLAYSSVEKHQCKAACNSLPSGKEVQFQIFAVNRNRCKSESLSTNGLILIAGKADAPSGPLLAASLNTNRVNLQWSSSKNNGGASISHYESFVKESNGDWNFLMETKELSLHDVHIDGGKEYRFKVCAVNQKGKSKFLESKMLPIGSPPSQIDNQSFKTQSFSDSCTLIWNAPTDNGGFETSSYRIEQMDFSQTTWNTITKNHKKEMINIKNLNSGYKYSFRIAARNRIGLGPYTELPTFIPIGGKPSEPLGPVKVREVTPQKKVKVEWQPPKITGGFQTFYRLEMLIDNYWHVITADNLSNNSIDLDCDQLGVRTRFKITASNIFGESMPLLSPEITLAAAPNEPTDLHVQEDQMTLNSATIRWIAPNFNGGAEVVNYVLEKRKVGEADWVLVADNINGNDTTYIITGLEEKNTYEFKLCAENVSGKSPYCKQILVVLPHAAQQLQRRCKLLTTEEGCPPVYLLPTVKINEQGALQKFRVDISPDKTCSEICSSEKVILVVGETGAGKSTCINGVVNYVCGVQFNDSFRFKLIEEGNKNQTESQTENISAYYIPKARGSALNYNLTLIDTPGFGDTKGIDRDKEIEKQLKTFFKNLDNCGVDQLHGICFIVQSSHARLTPAQLYIFNAILAMFGKDTSKNFLVLFTFADAQDPPALGAVREAKIPFQHTFKLNNSALFCNNTKKDSSTRFNEMFWEMGRENYKELFDQMEKMPPVSLSLTREVLETRETLHVILENLQRQLDLGLSKLNECRQEQDIVEKNQQHILDNKDFTYEIERTVFEKVVYPKDGKYDTNCLNCQITCHFPCAIAKDEDKKDCAAMDRQANRADPNCKVCSGKCHWSMHHNVGYRILQKPVKVKQSYAEMQKKYKCAVTGKQSAETMMDKIKISFMEIERETLKVINEMQCKLRRLAEIALRKHELTTVDHIDLLIQSEKDMLKYGWEKRVVSLMNMRKKGLLIKKSEREDFDPWQEWKKDKHSEEFWKRNFEK